MADKKISALTGASIPLAGTEVLPIVQGGATVKVAVSDLTSGRAVAGSSFTATGALAGKTLSIESAVNGDAIIVSGATGTAVNQSMTLSHSPGGGAYSYTKIQLGTKDIFAAGYLSSSYTGSAVVNAPHATGTIKFNVDDAQRAIISSAGNYTPLVAAKGVNFTANTPAAGMTSQLLNWYEEGTFTPTAIGSSPAGTTTYTTQTGTYTRVGNVVTFRLYVVSTASVGSGGALIVGGLPFPSSASAPPSAVSINLFNTISLTAGHVITGFIDGNNSYISFRQYLTGGGAVAQVAPQPVGFAISGQYNI